jgi:hypothetical protein
MTLAVDWVISSTFPNTAGSARIFQLHAVRASEYDDVMRDVVLFGTGNIAHVRHDIESILTPPLPAQDHARLISRLGHLVGIGLDLPDRVKNR